MSDWVNWQDFAEANKPEVARENDAAEAAQRAEKVRMDAQLSDLSNAAMRRAGMGQWDARRTGASYSDVMRQANEAMTRQRQQEIAAPWEADLGRKQYETPWAQLGARLGGINQKAADLNTKTRVEQARKAQEDAQKKWNEEQKKFLDEQMNGQKNRDAATYSAWSDYVQRHANGGVGAGAYYDWAKGSGPAPVMAPTSPMTDRTLDIYRRNPPWNPDNGFGDPNHAGTTIFTDPTASNF